MAERYDHGRIEKKWQEKWEASHAFAPGGDSSKPKQYILDMFPYPSGDGLHVGHVEGYTATDVYSRYKRMRGYDVLHPMGWDAFGLPAENYAIKTGVPPQQTTDRSIDNFRRQIKSLGLSYDWSREFGTHEPAYYRWTQWLFAEFFKKGLVYKKKALVNWDPVDQTVLANEQVLPDGTAERSGAKVEKKELEQWFFKITDYADELERALDTVDWPESTKIAQRNWIGASHGAEIEFGIKNKELKIKVFTTRPDTLFGATYLVLAPEHPLAAQLAAENRAEVDEYVAAAKDKSDIERSAEGKEKTGVEIKGVKAVNPANKEEIPIFVADYVLGSYGTGAIMAVPAHDERDWEFAKRFGLSVKRVVEPKFVASKEETKLHEGEDIVKRNAVCAVIRNPKDGTYLCNEWKGIEMHGLLTGGVEDEEDMVEAARREIREETGYKNLRLVEGPDWVINTFFYHRQKKQNRHARFHYLVFELENDDRDTVDESEKAKHEFVWKTREELGGYFTVFEGYFILNFLDNPDYIHTGTGLLGNSGRFDGMDSGEAKKKITEFVGGKMITTYHLRDWLISRQRYWGAPIPIVYNPKGVPHAIPAEHLPWLLPTDVEFRPTGTSPLGQSKELLERTEKIFGKGWRPEVDTMDTFVCSSWYFFRFVDPHNEKEFASKEAMQKWLPVDLYVGGAEHTVLHLLYARFFTKALRDLGHISFGEPFLKLRHQGTILAEDNRKMSKRWGNVINPDDMAARFGADAVRMYEMFMGPLEAMKPWNTGNVAGVSRFLERVWDMSGNVGDAPAGAATDRLMHQTIKKVSDDIESLKMNTAVSALMIFSNHLGSLSTIPKLAYGTLIKLLYPFAPHITSEIASKFGYQDGEIAASWPVYNAATLAAASVTVAVQVNGKVRATVELNPGAQESGALAAARANPAVAKWLAGGKEIKAVYVPGKIVSFVVKGK